MVIHKIQSKIIEGGTRLEGENQNRLARSLALTDINPMGTQGFRKKKSLLGA